jgi:hypothetical protein
MLRSPPFRVVVPIFSGTSTRWRSLGATEELVVSYVVTNLFWHVVAAFAIGLVVGWITAGRASD